MVPVTILHHSNNIIFSYFESKRTHIFTTQKNCFSNLRKVEKNSYWLVWECYRYYCTVCGTKKSEKCFLLHWLRFVASLLQRGHSQTTGNFKVLPLGSVQILRRNLGGGGGWGRGVSLLRSDEPNPPVTTLYLDAPLMELADGTGGGLKWHGGRGRNLEFLLTATSFMSEP